VIAIDQDRLGAQGDRVYAEGPYEIWAKPLADGSKAVGVFNRQDTWTKEATVYLDLAALGFKNGASARDIWQGKDLGVLRGRAAFKVPAHGVVLLKLKGVPK
jgi:alpha-galactosidase